MSRKILDESRKREILAIISVGCSIETAGRYVGCAESTIRREMRTDKNFAKEVLKAGEQSEVFFLQKIRKAAEKEQYWRAAAWALERRIPERYEKRGANTLTLEQVHSFMRRLASCVITQIKDPEERLAVIANIRKLMSGIVNEAAESTTEDDCENGSENGL